MAPQAEPEPLPIELQIVVGRKGQGAAWSCDHNDQPCPIKLPEKTVTFEKLSLRHLVILDDPKPSHGFLQVANTATAVSFDKFLELFAAAYTQTLKAQNFLLSKHRVKGIFFNYTDQKGQRLASPAYAPAEIVKNSLVLRSACFKDNPLPCNCGCNQSHHGPCAILILDGASWDQRDKEADKESRRPYRMIYKDDPLANIGAFSESSLAPIVAQQKISIKSAKVAITTALEEREKLTKEIEAQQRSIDSLKIEKEELESDAELHRLTMVSVEKNKVVAEKAKAWRRDMIERLKARNKELESDNKVLKTEINELNRKDSTLTDQVQDLLAQLTNSNSTLTVERQNHARALHDLMAQVNKPQTQSNQIMPRSENEVAEKRALTAKCLTLKHNLQHLAYAGLKRVKERAIIDSHLRSANIYLKNGQHGLALHELTQLLNAVSTFPIIVTAPELGNYVNAVMNDGRFSTALLRRVSAPTQPADEHRKIDTSTEQVEALVPPENARNPPFNHNTPEPFSELSVLSFDSPPENRYEDHPK